ncbi:MAG TPA: tRNA uridine-5-carboxymethylaminomethyl(34) synthesis enzyme MnmG [Clostridiales bacterium]|nr:tRNA uridine-5-carboxymethylaminomethyl(34) synthesis enzyme MnmG [Clostridiales bacterium]
MEYFAKEYQIIVIGAGHAGIEAGLAAARLGCKVGIFTLNLDWVGNLACNPSIGGTSKGHLVREIDALGGEMGKAADRHTLQSRMLNLGKGPAVHSPRAQIDRRTYSIDMKDVLERQEGLDLIQAEITDLVKGEDKLWQIKTRFEALYKAPCVILATGTFLAGRIYVGDVAFDGGPDGMFPANDLAKSLRDLGLPVRRFKTGTPARVNKRSVATDRLEPQYGDEKPMKFSFDENIIPNKNNIPCYITYTNEKTKSIISENMDRSPLYGGKIEGTGTRYCPSIEDKFVRFADKDRHQIFVEPCGLQTQEMYLQGLSSSLPEDVQLNFIRSVEGLENCEVMRTGYAIEYDCIDPIALLPTLEFQDYEGLYGAGQFNGSSGYEEAAAQGFIAGVNAAHKILGKPDFILDRASSYIGTLIDDLVTKGCADPYRMMTSRSEYRLLLRQDNADRRLTHYGYMLGLISQDRYDTFLNKLELIKEERARAESVVIPPSQALNDLLVSRETSPLTTGMKLSELLKRPQLNYDLLKDFDKSRPDLPEEIFEQVEIDIKYEGYIKRQEAQVEEMRRLEKKSLDPNLDYGLISGLRLEAREKLKKVRPINIGQASRISGVSPADITVLLIWLEKGGAGK